MIRHRLKLRIDPHGGADINYTEYDIRVNEMLSIRVKINSKECLVIRNFYLLNYREDFDNFRDIYKLSGKQDMFPEAQQCVLHRLADIDFTEKSLNNIGFFKYTDI